MAWRRTSQVCRGSAFSLISVGPAAMRAVSRASASMKSWEPTETVLFFEVSLYHFAEQSRQTYASMCLGYLK